MNVQDRADKLSAKINKITEKFDIADELMTSGDDLIDIVEEVTTDVELYTEVSPEEVINLKNMVDDFTFVRSTLKEIIENGRRVLTTITMELLEADSETRASLIMSFAELNNALSNNMKLYTNSYKDISTVLLNLDKMKQSQPEPSKNITNHVTINTSESISTLDLIARMNASEDK